MSKSEFKYLFNFAIIGFAGLVFLAVVGLTYLGMFSWYKVFFSSLVLHAKCFKVFK